MFFDSKYLALLFNSYNDMNFNKQLTVCKDIKIPFQQILKQGSVFLCCKA